MPNYQDGLGTMWKVEIGGKMTEISILLYRYHHKPKFVKVRQEHDWTCVL